MKISTYHKNKGDYVEFFKGLAPYEKIVESDRIYITTLFTFYFDKTIETINHYRLFYPDRLIYVGGIAASIMPDKFREKLGDEIHIQVGQRKSSNDMGYDDNVNVDALPLDYDILDDVRYKYPAADNYFAYTTRGCVNKCPFCAVPILEPRFEETNNLIEQITFSRETYGDHRNILLMDNNVLCSNNLKKLVSDLNELGFKNNTKNYVKPNFFDIGMKKINRRIKSGNSTRQVSCELISRFKNLNQDIMSAEMSNLFRDFLNCTDSLDSDSERIDLLKENQDLLHEVVHRYVRSIPVQRFVDFNQGIDARQITDENMSIFSNIPLSPFRLAYDHYEFKDTYEKAFRKAYKYGIRNFSNYMLYNYKETPEELWLRMEHNVLLNMEFKDAHVFSFPMKYAPIDETDRSHIGERWTKKQLDAMNVILNVTRGVVMGEDDFFYKAYGSTPEEFVKILAMPSEFIKHRSFFDGNGLIDSWRNEYDYLTDEERSELLVVLSKPRLKNAVERLPIMRYYRITMEKCLKINIPCPEHILLQI